jgi:hypothetical protein
MQERRKPPFMLDQAKFSTQERVTFYVIALVCSVIAFLCFKGGVGDIKEIYNTLLPIFAGVIGFWIGSSKGAADNREQLNKLLTPQPGTTTTTTTEKDDHETH